MIRKFMLALMAVAVAPVAAARTADAANGDASLRAAIHASAPACAGGLERILPGQYYFCAAVRDYGRGDDGLARARLRDAAYWGNKSAEYVLGLMSFNGENVPLNRPLGVAWLALASERHDQRFEPSFAKAYIELSPEERDQANAYWTDLGKNYADATAGKRAETVYNTELRNLQVASMFGGSIFIDGMTPPGITGNDPHINSNFGEASSLFGQSAFSAERTITRSADDLFQGMQGHVTVGEAQMSLVPIGSAVAKVSGKAN